jgi:predicted ATPase
VPTTTQRQLGNLPAELTEFIGRRRESSEIKHLLAQSRLVMLTGVGGAGKTRLALRVAAGVRRAFEDGVWLVDLSELRESSPLGQDIHDPEVLAYLVMTALELRRQGTGSAMRLLTEYLADRQTLLVLDNCEHVLPASAVLVDVLLRACPRVRVLATSREPLAIGGEMLYPVPPLTIPDLNDRSILADLLRCESVALFVTRARAAVAGFALTDDGVAVAELCHRLEGLPLAIELASAWVRVLSPQQILDRMADRFTLLSHGSRDAPARQQTLRACVAWSFELCTKPERLLWARSSVFVGRFELDAVEGVCADDCLPADGMVDVLAGLVGKSIVERVDMGDGHDEHDRRLRPGAAHRRRGADDAAAAAP